ncbi:MAG: hypothetical protein OHK0045_16190 [Raineya sp.]
MSQIPSFSPLLSHLKKLGIDAKKNHFYLHKFLKIIKFGYLSPNQSEKLCLPKDFGI